MYQITLILRQIIKEMFGGKHTSLLEKDEKQALVKEFYKRVYPATISWKNDKVLEWTIDRVLVNYGLGDFA